MRSHRKLAPKPAKIAAPASEMTTAIVVVRPEMELPIWPLGTGKSVMRAGSPRIYALNRAANEEASLV